MHDNVIQRVENLTGLDVTKVNITVKDVFFPSKRDKKDAHGSYRLLPWASRVDWLPKAGG
jgi:uncharacterized alkaline shock family protein YloU